MNRLLSGALHPEPPTGTGLPMQGPVPGSKPHLQIQARELGVPVRGTKEQIWQRIAAKQGENVTRRVRSPAQASQAADAAPAADPFDDALSRFEAYLGAR
jgi:hypothetical protein